MMLWALAKGPNHQAPGFFKGGVRAKVLSNRNSDRVSVTVVCHGFC